MSRGYWDYKNEYLKSDIFGFGGSFGDAPNVFEDREINGLIYDVFDLMYDFDSYKCGDSGRESYSEAVGKFKSKWFGGRDERLKGIVDEELSRVRAELMEVIG